MSRTRIRSLPRGIVLPRRWRRNTAGLLAATVISAVVVCDRSGLSPIGRTPDLSQRSTFNEDDVARYHDQSFRVVHVVDGDTLDIDAPDSHSGKPTTRIRLWGVDTPEVSHGGEREMYFGPEAMKFARDTLVDRTVQVVLSRHHTRDKFGRLLAYVFLEQGGAMFNELLVEEGYAYADPRFDHHYESRFAEAERRARDARAGLWEECKVADMPKWRQKREKKVLVP